MYTHLALSKSLIPFLPGMDDVHLLGANISYNHQPLQLHQMQELDPKDML
jgi:hypothetical protein